MKNIYNIAVVFWDDHQQVTRGEIPEDPDEFVSRPVLSVGIIYKETDKVLMLVTDFDRREDSDEASYYIILKSAIVGIKKYGKIKIDGIRTC